MSDKSISLLSCDNEFNKLLGFNIQDDQITVANTPKIIEKEPECEYEEKELHFNFYDVLDSQWGKFPSEYEDQDFENLKNEPEQVFEENLIDDCFNLQEDTLSMHKKQEIPELKVDDVQPDNELKIHLQIDGVKSQTAPSEPSNPPEKKRKTKRKAKTGLRKRKDVVFKALLRKIRSYYWKNFNFITKFNVLKKKDSREDLYKDCLKKYLQYEFGTESEEIVSPGLVLTLGDLMTSIGASHFEVNETYLTLYKFSIARLAKLCKNPDFMSLIHHFSDIFEGKRLTKDEKKGLKMMIDESLLFA